MSDSDLDAELEGFDPYDALDREASRLHAHLLTLDGDAWAAPTRCEGWSARDLLGHLRATEDYFQACVHGTVAELLGELGSRGATDVTSFNALGIADYADVPVDQIIEDWASIDADTRARFRAADGGDVDTSVGPYPCRRQAFHVAAELATHADDLGVPVTPDEEPSRTEWRTAFSRFALEEAKPDVTATTSGGTTHVRVGELEVDLANGDFVELVMGRDARGDSVPPEVRAALNTAP